MKRTFCTIIRDESAEGAFGLMSLCLSGGEFYTPRSEVRGLVEMLEQCAGRVYAPCCGSGSMFMQSEKFVEEHHGRVVDIAIYGAGKQLPLGGCAR